jgi:glutathione synthase/RimK-type ligase-like ATP-grasp enzyme
MKKVLILFGKYNWEANPAFLNKDNQISYEHLYSIARQKGIQIYRASFQWYDYDKHIFKYAWAYEAKSGWTRMHDIEPDLIYDKTTAGLEIYFKKELIAKRYRFVNSLRFTQMLNDKLVTSMIFHKWSKKSWVVNNPEKLQSILTKIKSRKLVIKPISESGGKNVQILRKEEALGRVTFDNDYIIQEFIDSSSGVPGVSGHMHDLRLVFVNDKICYAYIREPKEGNYLANLSQGGTLSIVPVRDIPKSLRPIIRCINRVFETFKPRIYSVDFMFDENKRPWIIELNSMPGLYFTPQEKPHMLELYQELVGVFLKKLEAV